MAITNETPESKAQTKTEKTPEKKAERKARSKELKAAKAALNEFAQTDEFKALPKGIQAAIKRVAPARKERSGSGGGGSNLKLVQGLLPTVGASVTELEVFKQTKKGRAEFRKLTRNILKKADPADRMWITFNEETESWTLVAVGENAPKGWDGFNPATDAE